MNGKIILKVPFMCVCVIKIDGKRKTLNPFNKKEIDISAGIHKINVGIEYYDHGDESYSRWSDIAWAWKEDKEILIDEKVTIIKIKRKWHLFKYITAEAIIKK